MKEIVLILMMFLWASSGKVLAQDISFTASAPKVVATNQQFEITYTANEQPSSFRPPSFSEKGIELIMGPSVNTQVYITSVQGRTKQESAYSYSYYVRCPAEGNYTLSGATCQISGKNYQSNSISFKVEKSAAPAQQPQTQQQPTMRQNNASAQPQALDEKSSFFIKAVASKTNPLQGEQVIITYKLYTLVPIHQYQISKLPANKGFWVEELDGKTQTSVKQYYENYNNQRYSVAEIRKIAVFPQESGNLTIAPLDVKIRARVQVRRQSSGNIFDIFDDPFFGGGSQTVDRDLKSNPVNISVSPLPTPPDGFSGAVGNFVIKSEVDNSTVKANEAISYKITISGKGNVMLIEQAKINFPQGFEIYDPKISSNISRSEAGVSGSKTFEWVLIPRTKGNYTIPSVIFVYYDAIAKKFVSQQSEQHEIVVEKGDGTANMIMNNSNKEEFKLLNSDIEYIKTNIPELQDKNTRFFRSNSYWILMCLPVLLLIIAVFVSRYIQNSKSNVLVMRLKMANAVAKKRLRKAEKFYKENNEKEFYIEVYQALWGYLSDKFGIPTANLSMDKVEEVLGKREIPSKTIAEVIETLNLCEFTRFAPVNSAEQMEVVYTQSINMITTLENGLK